MSPKVVDATCDTTHARTPILYSGANYPLQLTYSVVQNSSWFGTGVVL